MGQQPPLKAALLLYDLALGRWSTFGWDRCYNEAPQFDHVFIKICSPHPSVILQYCRGGGIMYACSPTGNNGSVRFLYSWRRTGHSLDCRETAGEGTAERGGKCGPATNHVFHEWYPGCPTLPSQPKLIQCQC